MYYIKIKKLRKLKKLRNLRKLRSIKETLEFKNVKKKCVQCKNVSVEQSNFEVDQHL